MKPSLVSIFFVVGMMLAGCSASSSQRPSATATSAPPPTSSVQILPTPASIISLDDRLLATLEISTGPDELLFLDGHIWVKTDDGHIIQVDPATNMLSGDVKVDTTSDHFHYCQGLGTDGGDIWVCSAAGDADNRTINVVRVDPGSREIVQTFEVNKVFDQYELPFLGGKIWVLTGSGDKLVGIDAATNELGPDVDLGARCLKMAVAGDWLFAACGIDDVILQIEPRSGAIIQRIDAKGPRYITGDENSLWVIQQGSVQRLDAETLSPRAEWLLRNVSDAFVTQEAAWILMGDGNLYRVDPESNAIVDQIQPTENFAAGSVLATSDSVWVTAYDDDLLLRISTGN